MIINIDNVTATSNEAQEKEGGVFHVEVLHVQVTVTDSTFTSNIGSDGGVFYMQTYEFDNSSYADKISYLSISSSTFYDNNINDKSKGAILYYIGEDAAKITISGGTYYSSSQTQIEDSLFYIKQVNSTLSHTVYITGSPYFSVMNYSGEMTHTGCIFYLTYVDLTDSGKSNYSDIYCSSGGVFYLSSSNVTITGATFENITAELEGGIIYADSEKNSLYTFSYCTFYNITATIAAIVYDESDCNSDQDNKTKKIEYCTISDI